MRGVSEVIAIILILMITISLAGLAYMFMSTTMSDVTASASSTVDTTTSSMLTSFTIESMDVAKVYIRNTGQSALTDLSVYVNGEPATFNVTPTSIATGAVGMITIYSFITDGATVKVTSTNGFSATKTANPCSKAVGCWKFDEGSGDKAYDSSPYANHGTLVNMNITGNATSGWTTGRYGSGLLFDNFNDYVQANNPIITLPFTISVLDRGLYSPNQTGRIYNDIIGMHSDANNGISLMVSELWTDRVYQLIWNNTTLIQYNAGKWSNTTPTWVYSVITYDGVKATLYSNGLMVGSVNASMPVLNSNMRIGYDFAYYPSYFNGTIDEVRIYNRAIY